MNKTKIEWADYTWNPVTGCLHGCPYCYAEKIAHRFCTNEFGKKDGLLSELHCSQGCRGCSEMDGMEYVGNNVRYAHGAGPFPFGFLPTYHTERLEEPQRVKTSSNIFVVSMGDLFGDWVPLKWIVSVIDACLAAPQHNYMFLTKNPARYKELQQMAILPQASNFWYGTTLTNNADFNSRGYDLYKSFLGSPCKTFLSIEPIHEQIKSTQLGNLGLVNWVIVGAETGTRKDKVIPEREWIDKIVESCLGDGVPVFMKDSLLPIMGERDMIREFPPALQPYKSKDKEVNGEKGQ